MEKKLRVADRNNLFVVNQSGRLRILFVPIPVKTMIAVGVLRSGSTVYVDQVAEHRQYMIVYRIFNLWYPHFYFKLCV
jgi:hypothetical protein